METRSRRKRQQTPTPVAPRSTSTPRSKRTSARTRPVLKLKEAVDDSYYDPKEETKTEFNDTPKHLYGKAIDWFTKESSTFNFIKLFRFI